MTDDFVNWEDLDLDSVLGENNWTDNERDFVGPEEEWFSSSDNETTAPAHDNDDDIGKENDQPPRQKSTTSRKHYKCPLCEKKYISPSGFRGHVSKKHDRPDIKAHKHQIVDSSPAIEIPERTVPLSTEDEFNAALPGIVGAAMDAIQQDRFLALPKSMAGQQILQIARVMNAQIAVLCAFLLEYFKPIYVRDNIEVEQILRGIHQLRLSTQFVHEFTQLISSQLAKACVSVPERFQKFFLQHFLTDFTTAFFGKQGELLDTMKDHTDASEPLSANDNQVLCYICGYMIHSLKKRYYRIKNFSKREQLLAALSCLNGETDNKLPSGWIQSLDRGGLKMPSSKFYTIVAQIERWVRESVNKNNLCSDSLISLHAKLLDANLLRVCWERLVPQDVKWLLLDHVVALFLKVRGFALVKLIRKERAMKRKQQKSRAGAKKALRQELKDMTN